MGYKEDIARQKIRITEVANEKIVDTVLGIHGRLVDNPPEGTPIDTGWASVNWFISVGAPTSGNNGVARANTAGRRSEQDRSVIAFASQYDYRQGRSVFIGNNTPYIRRLNFGHSRQSPAGFVERAVQIQVRETNRQKAKKAT